MGRGNGMKENRDERQTAGGAGGEVNEDCLIAKNVTQTAVVILAHSEYAQFHIVMIGTVRLGNPAAPLFIMKMEAVYSSESVVSVDTVSKPDSLGVCLHPALKQAMFRAGHAYCEGESAVQHDSGRLEWRCADLCWVLCLCISRIGNPGNSAECHLFIHSTAVYRGCIPLTTELWWESVSIFSFCIPFLGYAYSAGRFRFRKSAPIGMRKSFRQTV